MARNRCSSIYVVIPKYEPCCAVVLIIFWPILDLGKKVLLGIWYSFERVWPRTVIIAILPLVSQLQINDVWSLINETRPPRGAATPPLDSMKHKKVMWPWDIFDCLVRSTKNIESNKGIDPLERADQRAVHCLPHRFILKQYQFLHQGNSRQNQCAASLVGSLPSNKP